jgi:peptidoglycan/LPS O-acetylase OafA/YrhL
VLPAATATTVSWVLCQLGAFETARQSDAYWLMRYSPLPSSDMFVAFVDLKDALKHTWMFGVDNAYDQPQWALIYLLQGSLMIIGALVLTVNMASRWRMIVLGLLGVWSFDLTRVMGDPWTGGTCFMGIILAEASMTSLAMKLSTVSKILSPVLVVFALIIMSFTDSFPDKAPWNSALLDFGLQYFPTTGLDGTARMYGFLGGALLIFSIIISPHSRWLLSRRPLQWLGKVSFAIYLLHGMVLRSVFSWVLFAGAEKAEFREQEDNGLWQSHYRYPVPGGVHCAFATVVALAVTFIASQVWNMKVEPLFGKVTAMLESLMTGKSGIDDLLSINSGKSLSEMESLLPIRQD